QSHVQCLRKRLEALLRLRPLRQSLPDVRSARVLRLRLGGRSTERGRALVSLRRIQASGGSGARGLRGCPLSVEYPSTRRSGPTLSSGRSRPAGVTRSRGSFPWKAYLRSSKRLLAGRPMGRPFPCESPARYYNDALLRAVDR